MALTDDLERIAAARDDVGAVLATEAADGLRRYLVALGGGEGRRWLVVDDAGKPVTRRDQVRDTASIAAMCELAADLAAGVGVDAGEPPRLATPAYLDGIGAAASGSREFADALRAGTNAVEEFVRDVERGYALPLS
jgi:hypothetical protein